MPHPLAAYIEHTVLKPTLVQADVEQVIADAVAHRFVGVCVPPYWVKLTRRELPTDVALVTVVGFPFGYSRSEVKVLETRRALDEGATEIDMVLNLTAFKTGMHEWAKTEVAQLAKICHEQAAMLKVILETAYLTDDEIVQACELCASAGADFVKTSTGYAPQGATVAHVQLMRATVKEALGVKASGGIKTKEQALALVAAGADRLGTSSGVAIVTAP